MKLFQGHLEFNVTQWPDAIIRSTHCPAAATIDSVLWLGLLLEHSGWELIKL
jgi:hypothetical protein